MAALSWGGGQVWTKETGSEKSCSSLKLGAQLWARSIEGLVASCPPRTKTSTVGSPLLFLDSPSSSFPSSPFSPFSPPSSSLSPLFLTPPPPSSPAPPLQSWGCHPSLSHTPSQRSSSQRTYFQHPKAGPPEKVKEKSIRHWFGSCGRQQAVPGNRPT